MKRPRDPETGKFIEGRVKYDFHALRAKDPSEYYRQLYQENPEARQRKREYTNNHLEITRKAARKYAREKSQRYRNLIFQELGAFCNHCGELDIRCLQIDHVNGGGSKESKGKMVSAYYKMIYEKILAGSHDYQILCANCNWIKRFTNNEQRMGN